MNISDLKRRTRPLAVKFDEETLNLEYSPNRFTGELVDRVADAADNESKARLLATACADVLVSWDLTDGTKPFPPTHANLLKLPMSLLLEIFKAINEDYDPNRSRSSS